MVVQAKPFSGLPEPQKRSDSNTSRDHNKPALHPDSFLVCSSLHHTHKESQQHDRESTHPFTRLPIHPPSPVAHLQKQNDVLKLRAQQLGTPLQQNFGAQQQQELSHSWALHQVHVPLPTHTAQCCMRGCSQLASRMTRKQQSAQLTLSEKLGLLTRHAQIIKLWTRQCLCCTIGFCPHSGAVGLAHNVPASGVTHRCNRQAPFTSSAVMAGFFPEQMSDIVQKQGGWKGKTHVRI
jgi:hypothetical protein